MKRRAPRSSRPAILLVALSWPAWSASTPSSDPDGLNKVAEDQGFADTEKDHDSVRSAATAALTGILGVLVVLGLAGGLTYAVRRRDADASDDRDEQA